MNLIFKRLFIRLTFNTESFVVKTYKVKIIIALSRFDHTKRLASIELISKNDIDKLAWSFIQLFSQLFYCLVNHFLCAFLEHSNVGLFVLVKIGNESNKSLFPALNLFHSIFIENCFKGYLPDYWLNRIIVGETCFFITFRIMFWFVHISKIHAGIFPDFIRNLLIFLNESWNHIVIFVKHVFRLLLFSLFSFLKLDLLEQIHLLL